MSSEITKPNTNPKPKPVKLSTNPFLGDNRPIEGNDFSNNVVDIYEYEEEVEIIKNNPKDFRIKVVATKVGSENIDKKMQELDKEYSFEALLKKSAMTNDLSFLHVSTPLNKDNEIYDTTDIPLDNSQEVTEALTEKAINNALQEEAKKQQENKNTDPFKDMTTEQIEAYLNERKKGEQPDGK